MRKVYLKPLKLYINGQTQWCGSNMLVFIQHYYMFRLVTSPETCSSAE